jgi:hypothetical protein
MCGMRAFDAANHHDVDSVISELSQNVPSHPLIRPLSSRVGTAIGAQNLSELVEFRVGQGCVYIHTVGPNGVK